MEPVKQEIEFKIGFCVTSDKVPHRLWDSGPRILSRYPSRVGQPFTTSLGSSGSQRLFGERDTEPYLCDL